MLLQDKAESKDMLVTSPKIADEIIRPYVKDSLQEQVFVLGLNTRNQLLYVDLVSLGTLDEAIMNPRDVFRLAIVRGAKSIIVGHNHPSGDETPSSEDVKVSKKMVEAGKLLSVSVVDSLVLGDENFTSLKAMSLLD